MNEDIFGLCILFLFGSIMLGNAFYLYIESSKAFKATINRPVLASVEDATASGIRISYLMVAIGLFCYGATMYICLTRWAIWFAS